MLCLCIHIYSCREEKKTLTWQKLSDECDRVHENFTEISQMVYLNTLHIEAAPRDKLQHTYLLQMWKHL